MFDFKPFNMFFFANYFKCTYPTLLPSFLKGEARSNKKGQEVARNNEK